jgi:aminomethyltransferase
MQNTALFEEHRKLGARMVPFAGFNMPLEYTGVRDEHMNVRNNVGVFDVSHMGEIWVRGPHAFAFLQAVTTNDVSRLSPGKVQYSCLPNGRGGIVDDLLVYRFDADQYLLVVNASNTHKDWIWLNKQNTHGALLENASATMSQLAVQGPRALAVLQALTATDLKALNYYTFTVARLAGLENVIISATGYTGAGGFELYFPNEAAVTLWNGVFSAGKQYSIKPAGLAARDTLRLEMGYCLYGNDIDDTTSPIEAGLGWITRFTDEKNFIDKEFLLRQKTEGVERKLTGFVILDRGIPRQHYPLFDLQGTPVGQVTSGTMSPVLNTGIGMGYVKTACSRPGTEITVDIRNKKLRAKVVTTPFIK